MAAVILTECLSTADGKCSIDLKEVEIYIHRLAEAFHSVSKGQPFFTAQEYK